MTRLRSGAATDVGRVRQNNEDRFVVDDRVYAVADGMGGHRGGEVASKVAIDTLLANFVDHTTDGLVVAVERANTAVHDRAATDDELAGMGTTITVLAPIEEGDDTLLAIANVGDSRAYLFRDGELTQVSEDHSLVAEMEREGRLTAEEAAIHPHRNIVTRALGIAAGVDVDTFTIVPYEGDRFLLCSDGLYDAVDDDRVAAALRRLSDPEEAARELIRLANEGGGRDNITVVVVDVVDDEGRSEAASAAIARDRGSTEGHAAATDAEAAKGAKPATATTAKTKTKAKAKTKAPKGARPRRFTWRVAVFFVLVVAIVGGATLAIWMQARNTFFVGFSNDEVAIFRGKPGGVLWIDPTLEETTGVRRSEVPENRRADLVGGHEVPDMAAAERYIANLEDEIEALRRRGTTTTTTTTKPTTTTTTSPTTVATTVAPAPN